MIPFENVLKHDCFSNFDGTLHVFNVNDYDQISIGLLNKNLILSKEFCANFYVNFIFAVNQDEVSETCCTSEVQVPRNGVTKNGDAKIIDDELLIEAVRKRKSLWDMSKSKMPVQSKDLWSSVCAEIGLPLEMRNDVSSRWTNLRNRYLKARKTHVAYLKSGSAAKKQKFQSGFIYYEQMSFLSDFTDVPE